MAEATLGSEDVDMCCDRTPFPSLLCVLPDSSQKPTGAVHQKAIYQVYLPYCIVLDFSVPAVACLSAHRQVRPQHAGTPTNRRRVDDITVGPG